jgi:hypothetical protein
MHVSYRMKARAYSGCQRHLMACTEQACDGLHAHVLDALSAPQGLLALPPAAVELSLQASADRERERARVPHQWHQTRQRAQYEVDLAQRRYPAVDPAPRVVASTLERHGEQA